MKLRNIFGPGFILLLLLAGCQQSPKADMARSNALLKTDGAFSRFSAQSGFASAFQHYALADAVLLPQGGAALKGNPQIAQSLAGIPTHTRITWTPESSEASGDLGYSWGIYTSAGTNAAGQATVAYGKYLSIWKYRDDSWKLAVMMINQSPGPSG